MIHLDEAPSWESRQRTAERPFGANAYSERAPARDRDEEDSHELAVRYSKERYDYLRVAPAFPRSQPVAALVHSGCREPWKMYLCRAGSHNSTSFRLQR